jgi:hypothetical protein
MFSKKGGKRTEKKREEFWCEINILVMNNNGVSL